MNIIKKFLSENSILRPLINYKFNKTSITIHSTANPNSTAINERNWLDNPTNTRIASWHYCIDENQIIQAIPDNGMAYHCGKVSGNKYSLSIEICESGNREKTLDLAAKFTAYKLNEYNLTIFDIKKHADWVKKDCPRILINDSYIKNNLNWEWFIKRIKYYIEEGENMTQEKFNEFMNNWLVEQQKLSASDWAKNNVEKAKKLGITDGTMPQAFATREQVISMILNNEDIKNAK